MKLTRPIVFIDAETAGDANDVNPQQDRIISFACLKYMPDYSDEGFQFVCNPGIPIVPERSAVHGFTDDKVKDLPPFSSLAKDLLAFIAGCDLAGFNLLNYDVPLLWEECHRNGFTLPLEGVHIIDAGNIFKKKEPRDLTSAVRFYCEREHTGAHGAVSDVMATAEVLFAQTGEYDDLRGVTVEDVAKFSKLDDRVDLAGIIVRNKDGEPVFNTKRNRGVRVVDDVGYAMWIMRSDFSQNTKDAIDAILNPPQQSNLIAAPEDVIF